jgi:hypothetical protein
MAASCFMMVANMSWLLLPEPGPTMDVIAVAENLSLVISRCHQLGGTVARHGTKVNTDESLLIKDSGKSHEPKQRDGGALGRQGNLSG